MHPVTVKSSRYYNSSFSQLVQSQRGNHEGIFPLCCKCWDRIESREEEEPQRAALFEMLFLCTINELLPVFPHHCVQDCVLSDYQLQMVSPFKHYSLSHLIILVSLQFYIKQDVPYVFDIEVIRVSSKTALVFDKFS